MAHKGKQSAERQDNAVVTLQSGDKIKIEDSVSGSEAFVPILVDSGYDVKLVRIDQGVAENRQGNTLACDFFLDARSHSQDTQSINCFLELKGTKNSDQVDHAGNQILAIIQQEQAENNILPDCGICGDFVFAAISGAPDKTLPKMNNSVQKQLCRALLKCCKNRKDVLEMNRLLVYVKPNKRCNEAKITGGTAPHTIECWNNSTGFIPVPSMLLELINRK